MQHRFDDISSRTTRGRKMKQFLMFVAALAVPAVAAVNNTATDGGIAGLRARASTATAVDPAYLLEFTRCDGDLPGAAGKDTFFGHALFSIGLPSSKQYYLCSRDPSHVKMLDRLADGTIHWRSKMALDVDGSWAAWAGMPGATDQKETSYKWPNVADHRSQAAQLDPDRIPFIVIPIDGLAKLTGSDAPTLGRMFRDKTGIAMGDLGVVIVGDRWTPVIVGDGGPFMRLGEGSARVLEEVGQSRCRQWNDAKTRCVGLGRGQYPYRNFGIGSGVDFFIVAGSRRADMTAENALPIMCAFAHDRFGLTGSTACGSTVRP
jgi:hypothetical protein